MEFTEKPELTALRETVGQIAGRYGGTYYAEHAAAHTPLTELWTDLAKAGFIGINVPEEFGGGGGGLVELSIVCEEIAAQGCPMLLLLVSAAISAEVIARYGDAEQKQRWLPGLADGTSKVVFAITEPGAGSNTHQLSTSARRDGGDWLLSGTKYYISGVDEAQALLVVARTGTDELSGKAQMSLFLVPTDAQGLVVQPLPVDAMLPERQFTLFFDDVRVGPEMVVGEVGAGFAQVFHGLNPERITGAALCVGIARYALGRAAAYAKDRTVWSTPIGAHQGVSHPLAKAAIETELAALMTRKAAWAHDSGQRAVRFRTWPSTPRRRQRSAPSTPRSRLTAATGCPPSTAWSRTGGSHACSGSPRSTGRWS